MREWGFTLIELLIVVALVGILLRSNAGYSGLGCVAVNLLPLLIIRRRLINE